MYHKLQTKVVCCCSMGAAWGDNCAKCPQKGTQAYKQMCGSGVPGMMVDPVTGVTHEIDECQMMPGQYSTHSLTLFKATETCIILVIEQADLFSKYILIYP